MKKLLIKYKEVLLYLVFGGLTTVLGLFIYFLLTSTIFNPNNAIELQITNIIAWLISVLFAFFTNKKYVFESNNNISKELFKFMSLRTITLFSDMLIMYIGVSVLLFDHKIIKIISEIIIIVSNYIFSKLFVFKK